MAKTVNHRERKREIRAISLGLFARHGFEAVNFGMIAAACGISRTLLYTYFRDKLQIFNEAIDEATAGIGKRYRELAHSRMPADAKLRQVCVTVLAMLHDNREFLCVIVDYLCSTRRRRGTIPVEYVVRHTLGLRRILHSFLVEAVHRGEYDPGIDVNRTVAVLYTQFEAAALRLTVSGQAELSESIDLLNAMLFTLRLHPEGTPRFL